MPAIDPIKLPSGGRVTFKDLDDLTGRDFMELTAQISSDAVSTIMTAAPVLAAKLITSWEIPYDARLPIPTAKGGQNSLGQLTIKDMRKITSAVIPLVKELLMSEDEDSPEGKDEPEPDDAN